MSEHVDTSQKQDHAHQVHSGENRGCRGCTAAITVIRNVVHLGCYFEYGAVEVAIVVVVDEQKVRGAVPFAWIVSINVFENKGKMRTKNLLEQLRAIRPKLPYPETALVSFNSAVLGINRLSEPKLNCRLRLWLAMYNRCSASGGARPGGR